MEREHLDPFIEAIADGSWEADAAGREHLAGCERCTALVAQAREIDRFLAVRDVAQPPPNFTTTVMSGVVRESWQTERVVDLGFNLAMAAGILVILTSAAGVAFSMGLLTFRIDFEAIEAVLNSDVARRILSQAQTVGLAAGLLTMALVLWWWAETESV
jgi:predicted anti-sigma-YlaC factor YlaD